MAVRTKQSIEDTRSANVRALTDDYWFSNRKGMSPLDEPLGLEKEAIEPLGDLVLNLDLSGRLGQ
jgi:hypothetical protein